MSCPSSCFAGPGAPRQQPSAPKTGAAFGSTFFRQALTQGFDSLKVRHAEGASGRESVRAHAPPRWTSVIFSLTRLIADDTARARLDATPLVVVALGGYGRRELHPLSDIDLMVVYDGELSPYVQRMMQELLYSLWDLGLQVGHSLRSLDDCVAMARTDFPSRTSMQEARFLSGDRRLFARFRRVLRENVYRRDFAQFLETTLERARSAVPRASAPRPTSASRTSRSRRAGCGTCTPRCGWARPSSAPARCASWPTRGSSRRASRPRPTRR